MVLASVKVKCKECGEEYTFSYESLEMDVYELVERHICRKCGGELELCNECEQKNGNNEVDCGICGLAYMIRGLIKN